MRYSYSFLLLALCLPVTGSSAQAPAQAKPAPKPTAAATASLPPFSGTWILDNEHSKLARPINGESKAVIAYDGKTWHYVHSHQETPADDPDQWQTTLVVGSQQYDTQPGIEITFHSRIARVGNAMVLTGYGVTGRGQRSRNMVRYTLEDGGNTLIETETTTNMLGSQHNLYVLHRYGTQPAAK